MALGGARVAIIVRVKEGINLDRTHPRLWMIPMFASICWEQVGVEELIIVGASRQALDLFTSNIVEEKRSEATRLLGKLLGPAFHIVSEKAYCHVQYNS